MTLINKLKTLNEKDSNEISQIIKALQETNIIYNRDTDFFSDEGEVLYQWDYEIGGTKAVILTDNFIFKTTLTGLIDYDDNFNEFTVYVEKDYAKIEYLIYQNAIIEGVDKFFAPIEDLGCGVYVQEKVDLVGETPMHIDDCWLEEDLEEFRDVSKDQTEQEQMFRKKWLKFITENSLFELPIGFLVDSLRRGCTLEELTQLNAFLAKYDINDLHENNIGVIDGSLVFFDFSGYESSTSEIVGAN